MAVPVGELSRAEQAMATAEAAAAKVREQLEAGFDRLALEREVK
jgi:hypothetical protein